MILGILGDSHDRYDAMAQAVALLRGRGAQYLLHTGDVVSTHMLDHLAGIPSAFVWGNCDFDRLGLQRYAEKIQVACWGAMGQIELDGKKIALLHGDDPRLLRQVLDGQQFDYVLTGHTHIRRDIRIGRTRHINPGALHRAPVHTVALLDLSSDALAFLSLNPGG